MLIAIVGAAMTCVFYLLFNLVSTKSQLCVLLMCAAVFFFGATCYAVNTIELRFGKLVNWNTSNSNLNLLWRTRRQRFTKRECILFLLYLYLCKSSKERAKVMHTMPILFL